MSKIDLENVRTYFSDVSLNERTVVRMQVTVEESQFEDNTRRSIGEGTRLVSGALIDSLLEAGPDACYLYLSQGKGQDTEWTEERLQDALECLREQDVIAVLAPLQENTDGGE